MTARLGILLSGGGSTYQNLVQAIETGHLPASIAVVVSSRERCGGVDKARANGHRLEVARDPERVTAALQRHGAEWVAMCGWMRFWDPPALYAGRVLNIHPSLLPAFGGQGMYGHHVHAAVLAHGCQVSGCTVHVVEGAYDTGPILAQQAVAVHDDDTPDRLAERVQAAERALYPRVWQAVLTGGVVREGRRARLPGLSREHLPGA